MTIRNNKKITCVGAQFCTRGLSLETAKKGGSMGDFFLNHGFSELGPEYKGKQGPKGSKEKIPKVEISNWEVLRRDLTETLVDKGVRTNKAKPSKLTKWAKQLIAICRRLNKSVRKLVQGWLAIRQKNTVVWGDFSYGY